MAMAAGGLAIGPRLAVCREGATPATDVAAPLAVDPGVPWWLQNDFEPMFAEVEAFDLPVTRALPLEPTDLYLRSGPVPKTLCLICPPKADDLEQNDLFRGSGRDPRAFALPRGAPLQRNSIDGFFVRNRHFRGPDSPRKALLTTVEEAVETPPDACEEAGLDGGARARPTSGAGRSLGSPKGAGVFGEGMKISSTWVDAYIV